MIDIELVLTEATAKKAYDGAVAREEKNAHLDGRELFKVNPATAVLDHCAAILAVHYLTKLPYDLSEAEDIHDPRKTDCGRYRVRVTGNPTGRLVVKKRDPDPCPVVHVIGTWESRKLRVLGFAYAWEVRQYGTPMAQDTKWPYHLGINSKLYDLPERKLG